MSYMGHKMVKVSYLKSLGDAFRPSLPCHPEHALDRREPDEGVVKELIGICSRQLLPTEGNRSFGFQPQDDRLKLIILYLPFPQQNFDRARYRCARPPEVSDQDGEMGDDEPTENRHG